MKQLKKILSVLLVLAMIVAYVPPVTASAETETKQITITFDANKTDRESQNSDSQVWKKDGLTFTNNKDSSSNAVGDYSDPVRIYQGSGVVIECENMTKIVIVSDGTSKYKTALTNTLNKTGATYTTSGNNYTITFAEPVDSFSMPNFTAQARFKSITVSALVGGGSEQPTKYDVSFDLDYPGAVNAPAKITREENAAYGELPTAIRVGYEFVGWCKTAGGTGAVVTAEDNVTEEHTLYAKWKELPPDTTPGIPTDLTLSFSTTANRTTSTTSKQVWEQNGIVFTYDKASYSNNLGDYSNPVRLYKGTKVTVTCGHPMTQIVFVGSDSDEYKEAIGASLTAAGIFYTLSGDNYIASFASPVDSVTFSLAAQARIASITVTAKMPVPEVFDVSFDLNGAEGTAPATRQVEEGAAYGELPEVSREGYTFDGWYKTADCSGEAVTAEDTVSEEHTLYAKWTYIPTEDSSDIVENWGLTLKDEVIMKFDMNFTPEILADNEAYVEVAVNGSAPYTVPVAEDMILSVPVFATQMTETITLTTVSGGEAVASKSFTLLQYCKEVLNNNEYSQYHALVKELLNYGDAAMKYFKPSADKFAGAEVDLAGTGKNDVPVESPAIALGDQSDVLDCTGASLVYRDKIAVRYYFTGSLTGCTFSVTGANGKAVVNAAGGYVEVPDILPQDLDQEITLSVTDGEGKVLTITYCPMNYIVRMSQKGSDTTKALVRALYNYYLAAKDFAAQTV